MCSCVCFVASFATYSGDLDEILLGGSNQVQDFLAGEPLSCSNDEGKDRNGPKCVSLLRVSV